MGWQRINAHFFNAIEVERNVMFVILTLIVLVAAMVPSQWDEFSTISGMPSTARRRTRTTDHR